LKIYLGMSHDNVSAREHAHTVAQRRENSLALSHPSPPLLCSCSCSCSSYSHTHTHREGRVASTSKKRKKKNTCGSTYVCGTVLCRMLCMCACVHVCMCACVHAQDVVTSLDKRETKELLLDIDTGYTLKPRRCVCVSSIPGSEIGHNAT